MNQRFEIDGGWCCMEKVIKQNDNFFDVTLFSWSTVSYGINYGITNGESYGIIFGGVNYGISYGIIFGP